MTAQQYYASIKADRDAWRQSQPQRCMRCLRAPGKVYAGRETILWLEVHEIEHRSQAPNNWWHRCSALLLCHYCHPKMGGKEWPHARQLALKYRMDPANYDLAAWLAIKPRPDTYVTEDEIRRAS